MKKLFAIVVASAALLAFNANAGDGNYATGNWIFGTNDVSSGSHCKVKDVVLLAKSKEDCAKAGGKVVEKK